jgi:hypothetical protein
MRHRKARIDISGKRFGRLVVQDWAGSSRWRCLCDCGKETLVLTANLNRGNTTSCGCIRNAIASKRNTTHGLSNTHVYKTWLSMRRRCREVSNAAYKDYGAKGIDVIDRWFDSVEEFVKDVGHPPTPEHTLDRINNLKGYQPDNVRWATSTEQARNRGMCVQIDFQGHHFDSVSHFVEWLAPQLDVNRKTLLREVQKCI